MHRRAALVPFIEFGFLVLDNNSELALHAVAMSRSNRLFEETTPPQSCAR